MQLHQWVWLLLAQSVWAGSYVAMKTAGAEMPVGSVVVFRYGIATLALLALAARYGLPRLGRGDLWLVIALGALNFTLAPTLQVWSLRYTQAVDVSILIALEPTITVAAAAIALRERTRPSTLAALLLGTLGMVILSGAGFSAPLPGAPNRLLGNAAFVLSLVCEASVTVAGGHLARRYPPMQSILLMKAAGFLVALLIYGNTAASTDFSAVSMDAWYSILYLALLSSAFAYTVWYHVIRTVPVNHVALSLFAQPLAGAALGYALLGEHIGYETLTGAVLICASLVWWQARDNRSNRIART